MCEGTNTHEPRVFQDRAMIHTHRRSHAAVDDFLLPPPAESVRKKFTTEDTDEFPTNYADHLGLGADGPPTFTFHEHMNDSDEHGAIDFPTNSSDSGSGADNCSDESSFGDTMEELEEVISVYEYSATKDFFRIMIEKGTLLLPTVWMIATAVAQGPVALEVAAEADMGQLLMFISLARLVHRLGPVATSYLSAFLLDYERLCLPEGYSPPHRLPFTLAEIRQQILNTTNQNSLERLLPVPSVLTVEGNAAYIPAKEMVPHALSMQPPLSDRVIDGRFQNLLEVHRNKVGGGLPKKGGLLVLYYLWMDGWDPSRSLTKLNKTPIWTATVTMIFACARSLGVVAKKTVLAAVAPGKADHQPVLRKLLESFDELEGGTVYNERKRVILECAPLHISADQPEKRSITGTFGGNSTNHPFFGASCYFGLLPVPFGSCGRCNLDNTLEAISEHPVSKAGCQNCLDWTMPPLTMPPLPAGSDWCRPEVYLYTEPVFPHSKDIAGAKHYTAFNTGAGRLTNAILLEVFEECYQGYTVSRTYTADQVKNYFRLVCLSEHTTKGFLDRCSNIRALDDCSAEPCRVSPTKRQKVLSFANRNPNHYEKPKPPILWSRFPLHCIPETPMHLMMGVVKAVNSLGYDWASCNNMGTVFVESLNVRITLMHRFARISYYPVARFGKTGSYPGWVGDTCRTWWQLMPWVYDSLPEKLDPTTYVQPTTNHGTWNGKQCQQFLRSKGTTGVWKLNAAEAKSLVEEHLSLPPSKRPPTVIPAGSDVDLASIRTLAFHTYRMMSLLFRAHHDETSKRQAKAAVKVFLTAYTRIDHRVNGREEKDGYLSKFNFISLLRSLENMDYFGSLLNIQEGGDDGEGLVKKMRKLTPRGLKANFASNLLLRFNRQEILNMMYDLLVANATGSDDLAFREKFSQLATQEETEVDAVLDSAMASDFNETPEPLPYRPRLGQRSFEDIIWDVGETQRYKRYKTLEAVRSLLEYGLPVSTIGIAGRDGLWCQVRATRATNRFFYKVILSRGGVEKKEHRIAYYKVRLDHDPIMDIFGAIIIVKYGLLLPHEGCYSFLGGEQEVIEEIG
jgi:hypothetical protein